MAEKVTGTVKWFDREKGYGFILREGGSDIFVHFTGIMGEGYRTLFEGEKVEFQTGPAHKGDGEQAVNVVVLEPSDRRKKRDAKRAKAQASSEA